MERLGLYVRYGIVGAIGAIVQTSALYLWVSLLHLYDRYLWGVVIGFCIALALTFVLQKYWTFRDPDRSHTARQLAWYTAIALASLCLNTLLLHQVKGIFDTMQIDFFKFWYVIAEAAIVVFVAVMSFLANRFFTFNSA